MNRAAKKIRRNWLRPRLNWTNAIGKMSPRFAAFYALIDEARCYAELGDRTKALKLSSDVLAAGSKRGNVPGAGCGGRVGPSNCPAAARGDCQTALEIYLAWEKIASRRDQPNADVLAIKCLGGEAALECARRLNENTAAETKLRNECLKLAKDLFTFSAGSQGEFQESARLKLADPLLAGDHATADAAKQPIPSDTKNNGKEP